MNRQLSHEPSLLTILVGLVSPTVEVGTSLRQDDSTCRRILGDILNGMEVAFYSILQASGWSLEFVRVYRCSGTR